MAINIGMDGAADLIEAMWLKSISSKSFSRDSSGKTQTMKVASGYIPPEIWNILSSFGLINSTGNGYGSFEEEVTEKIPQYKIKEGKKKASTSVTIKLEERAHPENKNRLESTKLFTASTGESSDTAIKNTSWESLIKGNVKTELPRQNIKSDSKGIANSIKEEGDSKSSQENANDKIKNGNDSQNPAAKAIKLARKMIASRLGNVAKFVNQTVNKSENSGSASISKQAMKNAPDGFLKSLLPIAASGENLKIVRFIHPASSLYNLGLVIAPENFIHSSVKFIRSELLESMPQSEQLVYLSPDGKTVAKALETLMNKNPHVLSELQIYRDEQAKFIRIHPILSNESKLAQLVACYHNHVTQDQEQEEGQSKKYSRNESDSIKPFGKQLIQGALFVYNLA